MNTIMLLALVVLSLYQVYAYVQTCCEGYRPNPSVILSYFGKGFIIWTIGIWIEGALPYLLALCIAIEIITHRFAQRLCWVMLCFSYVLGYGVVQVLANAKELAPLFSRDAYLLELLFFTSAFLIQQLMMKYQNRTYDQMYTYPFFVMNIFLLLILMMLVMHESSEYLIFPLYGVVLMMMAIYRYCYCMEVAKEKEWIAMQKQQMMSDNQERYERIQQEHSYILKNLHDIKKQMRMLDTMQMRDHSYYQALKEKADVLIEHQSCGDATLDQALRYYQLKFHEAGIQYNMESEPIDYSFMDPVDLIALLCNLLDNAYESCQQCEERFILFKMHQIQGSILWKMKNAMGIEVSKKHAFAHGFGLRNIEDITKRYHGNFHTEVDEEHHVFISNVMLNATCANNTTTSA